MVSDYNLQSVRLVRLFEDGIQSRFSKSCRANGKGSFVNRIEVELVAYVARITIDKVQ